MIESILRVLSSTTIIRNYFYMNARRDGMKAPLSSLIDVDGIGIVTQSYSALCCVDCKM